MNKFLLFLLLSLLSFGFASCNDDDVEIMDLNLLAGQWEVVSQTPERSCIYDITTAPDLTEGTYDGHYGKVSTTRFCCVCITRLFCKFFYLSERNIISQYGISPSSPACRPLSFAPPSGQYLYLISQSQSLRLAIMRSMSLSSKISGCFS